MHRRGSRGTTEILLVHRPRYDDWTLPKGKAEPGEPDDRAALREVEEETGLAVALDRAEPVAEVAYQDRHGRPKRVRYWPMHVVGDADRGAAGDEVDAVIWLPIGEACRRLTYERDRRLLSNFEREA